MVRVQRQYGETLIELEMKTLIFGFKGFMAGYMKGLLNNDMHKVDDKCFGTVEIQEDIQFGYEFMSRMRPISDVLKFTTRTVGVINTSMDDCGYTGSVKMLQDFCRKHYTPAELRLITEAEEEGDKPEKPRCSQSTLIRNFYTRIFSHIASY